MKLHARAPVSADPPRVRRWVLLAFLMALCFFSHFNRASITSAGDARIMTQYGISPEPGPARQLLYEAETR
jgi:hypothetical protein